MVCREGAITSYGGYSNRAMAVMIKVHTINILSYSHPVLSLMEARQTQECLKK